MLCDNNVWHGTYLSSGLSVTWQHIRDARQRKPVTCLVLYLFYQKGDRMSVEHYLATLMVKGVRVLGVGTLGYITCMVFGGGAGEERVRDSNMHASGSFI